jgi:hypothetical protein
MFFVNELQFSQGVKCPSCLAPVGLQGPSAEAPRKKTVRVLTTPDSDPSVQRLRKILTLMVASAVVVIGLVVVLILSTGGSAPAPEAPRRKAYWSDPGPGSASSGGGTVRPGPAPRKEETSRPATPSLPDPHPSETVVRQGPPAPPPPEHVPPPGPALIEPLPPELLEKVRTQVQSLPAFYREMALSSPERSRMEGLLAVGKGTREDAGFLQGLLSGAKLKVVRDEIDSIREAFQGLEKEAFEGLPVDKVVMKDKRVRNVRIIEETPEFVRISQRMAGGVSGEQRIPIDQIELVQKGRGLGTEFKTRWEAAQKADVPTKIDLFSWCKENSLTLQARLVCFSVLRTEPGHAVCRSEAGLPPDPVQVVVRAQAEGGTIVSYLGRSWTPRELKEKLLRDGYVLFNGEWYAKKDRMISVPGLFKYEKQADKPVSISAIGQMSLTHDMETTYRTVQDVQSGSFSEQPEVKYTRRYYGPTLSVRTQAGGSTRTGEMETRLENDQVDPPAGRPMEGEVMISIPVNQPILEASVMMVSEVRGGGTITVYLVVEGDRKLLYRAAGKDQESRKLPDAIRGRTSIDLVAVMTATASYIAKVEKRHIKSPVRTRLSFTPGLEVQHNRQIPEAQVALFPSNSNTFEVFRLTLALGEPAPALNAVFARAGASDVLKQ